MDQSEQTQAKPRHRRRWLIVAVVLVLLASVSCWYWPRGDARFVGKWSVANESGKVYVVWTLGPNGLAIATDPASGPQRVISTWRVSEGRLTFGQRPNWLHTFLNDVANTLSGGNLLLPGVEQRFPIREVNKGSIWVTNDGNDIKSVLTRLPE